VRGLSGCVFHAHGTKHLLFRAGEINPVYTVRNRGSHKIIARQFLITLYGWMMFIEKEISGYA